MLPLEPHVWFTAVCKLRASKTGVERSSLSHFPPGHPPRKTSVHSLSTLRIPKAREVLTPPFQLQGAHQKNSDPMLSTEKVKTLKVRGRGVRLRRRRLCKEQGSKGAPKERKEERYAGVGCALEVERKTSDRSETLNGHFAESTRHSLSTSEERH